MGGIDFKADTKGHGVTNCMANATFLFAGLINLYIVVVWQEEGAYHVWYSPSLLHSI